MRSRSRTSPIAWLKSPERRIESLFCPDCGTDLKKSDKFCSTCGYPADALTKRIEFEKNSSIGWAERIIGKKPGSDEIVLPEGKLHTFTDVSDSIPESDKEKSDLRCETCGSKVEHGTLCPACGERLPTLSESDNFFAAVMSKFFKLIFAPRYFAQTLPYPLKGGTMQALWIPAIITGLYILTLPAARPFMHLHKYENYGAMGLGLIGMTVYILFTPLLLFLTSGLNHWVAVLFGGHAPFRRTVRVTGAGLAVLMTLGLIRNIVTAFAHLIDPDLLLPLFIQELSESPEKGYVRFIVYALIIIGGWYHCWLIGGLHRLSWWKAVIHFIAAYVTFIWWIWVLVLYGIPLFVSS